MTAFLTVVQTVVTAMSELDPPIELANPENKERVKYLLEVVAKPGFTEYTPVSHTRVDKTSVASYRSSTV